MSVVEAPRSIRECFHLLGTGKVTGVADYLQTDCSRIAQFLDEHPGRGLILQQILYRWYRRSTGKTEAIDWANFLKWLTENLPKILEIIIGLIAIFG
jgi:hypothetical protein